MKNPPGLEELVYTVVIALSLATLLLLVLSPSPFLNVKAVYGGF
jgi:hypothetical protein